MPRRVGRDKNMLFIQKLGLKFSKIEDVPLDLTPEKIAVLVDRIDGPLINGQWFPSLMQHEISKSLGDALEVAQQYWMFPRHDIEAQAEYMSILLRLWSGCISGAKCIAYRTRSGPNTPWFREHAFRRLLWHCRRDRIFHAGLKAAPAFKRLRKEGYSYKGGEKKVLEELFGRRFP